ncbi:TetR/AcrR family transcriptional regulator [Streptomyces albiaxialis]|uniref:TetR/AcrR family transcriptional regulator n=1 Tax=Streptomyces albiaxialis TaxID=329523 RepID=A0ABP5I3M7_9ACTN
MEDKSAANGDRAARDGVRAKDRYHHGDLRNALIEAATGLAREGGPGAVVLRAAARRVGVSPTAAYRHFEGQADLLDEVKQYGQRRLAEHMLVAGAEVAGDGPEAAVARIRALGRGYVRFAVEEPGLFSAAFGGTEMSPLVVGEAGGVVAEDQSWRAPAFDMLAESLDALVACGLMPAERRPGAEVSAWAMAHGLATLVLEGPLAGLPAEMFEHLVERALSDIVAGFTAPAP